MCTEFSTSASLTIHNISVFQMNVGIGIANNAKVCHLSAANRYFTNDAQSRGRYSVNYTVCNFQMLTSKITRTLRLSLQTRNTSVTRSR